MRPVLAMLLLALPLGGCFVQRATDPEPNPPAPSLEKISLQEVMAGPQRFSSGIVLTADRDEDGEIHVTLSAAGQHRRLSIADDADFFAPSNRADIVIMHDRYTRWVDTLRVFQFSPAGIRERTYGHGDYSRGYNLRIYRGINMYQGHVLLVEDLAASGRSNLPPSSRRYSLPLD